MNLERARAARGRAEASLSWVAVAALGALSAALLAAFLYRYDLSFVHPHRFENHLPMLVPESIRLQWRDLVLPFQEFAAGEYRPRFLTYAIILLDLKLRLAFYQLGVLPPAFSISWVLQVLSAWLLFRVVVGFLQDGLIAILAVFIFVTSTGFLSGFTMLFMPGKPLSGLIFLLIIWLMARLDRRGAPDQLFHQVPGVEKYWVMAVLFLGLLLDETPLFALLLPLIFFPERFVRWPIASPDLHAIARAGAAYAIPVAAFLLFVLVVTPAITQHFFGYTFRYFETLIGFGQGTAGAKSILEGPYGGFSVRTLISNFLTLFGASLVPWQISPLVALPGSGGVLSGQKFGLLQLGLLIPVFGGIGFLAWRAKGDFGRRFRSLILATLLFVLFQSMLSGRHVPYITGYYYGAAFSIFFAMLAGFSFAALVRIGVPRLVMIGASALIVLIQANNFHKLNKSYLHVHNERMARPSHSANIPLSAEPKATRSAELFAIWQAWRQGQLDRYLAASPASAGAIFLVVELRWLDRLKKLN